MTFYISVHHSLHIVCFTAHNSFSVRTVYSTCKDAKRGIASSRLRKFVRPLNRSAIAIIVRVWYVESIWDYKIYISGWSINYCLSKLRWKDECAKIDFTKCLVIFKSSKASIDQGKNYLTKYLNQDNFCYTKYYWIKHIWIRNKGLRNDNKYEMDFLLLMESGLIASKMY